MDRKKGDMNCSGKRDNFFKSDGYLFIGGGVWRR